MKFAKVTATLLASIGLLSTAKAFDFDLETSQDGVIDAKIRRMTKDGRDADQMSLFE